MRLEGVGDSPRRGMSLYRYLLAEDVFICYARADGYKYAEACASHLSKAGRACAFDQWTSLPGDEPPDELWRALRRSCVMVVVGSPQAARSAEVRKEIETFSRLRRPIVPISFAGSLHQAVWFGLLRGGPVEVETLDALEAGQPSDAVFRRIENAFTHRTRSQRQALASAVSVAFVLVTLAVGGYLLWRETALVMDAEARAAAANGRAEEGAKRAEEFKLSEADAVRRRDQADRDARSTELAIAALEPDSVEEGLELSLDALAISPTTAARQGLLENLSLVAHLRRRVLCPPDEEPQSAYFSKDNRLLLVCSRTMFVYSLPALEAAGRVSLASGGPFLAAGLNFIERGGRLFAFQELVSPKPAFEYLVWPPTPRAALPEGPGVERSTGATTAELWQRSKHAALLRKIQEENCNSGRAPLAAVNDQGTWGACTTDDHAVLAFRLEELVVERETLRGHTESPPGHRAASVELIAFDRNQETRFLATGGELAGGRAGFLLWDLEQQHPVAELVRPVGGDGNGPYGLVLGRSGGVAVCSGCGPSVEIIELEGGGATAVRSLASFALSAASPSGNVVFLEGPDGIWRLRLDRPYRLERLLTSGVLNALMAADDDHVFAIEERRRLLAWSPAGVRRAGLGRLLPPERRPIPLAPSELYTCAALGEGGKTLLAEFPISESRYKLLIAEFSEGLAVTRSRVMAIPEEAGSCARLDAARAVPKLLRIPFPLESGETPLAVLADYWNASSKLLFITDPDAGGVIAADGKTAVAGLGGGFSISDLVENRFLRLTRPPRFAPRAFSDVALAANGAFFLSVSGERQKALLKWRLDYDWWRRRAEAILAR